MEMATYALSFEHAAAHEAARGLRQRTTGLVATVFAAWRRHAEMRRAERQLGHLSDRMLDDIGLKREDIATAVRGLPPVRDDDRPIPYWSR
jgi:uncharacterized protein YjiS (DUF1127 family)